MPISYPGPDYSSPILGTPPPPRQARLGSQYGGIGSKCNWYPRCYYAGGYADDVCGGVAGGCELQRNAPWVGSSSSAPLAVILAGVLRCTSGVPLIFLKLQGPFVAMPAIRFAPGGLLAHQTTWNAVCIAFVNFILRAGSAGFSATLDEYERLQNPMQVLQSSSRALYSPVKPK